MKAIEVFHTKKQTSTLLPHSVHHTTDMIKYVVYICLQQMRLILYEG